MAIGAIRVVASSRSSARSRLRCYAHAVRWYQKAAEQNGTAAQIDLGMMYYRGQGVPRDYVQAYMWAIVATSNSPSGRYREVAAKNRDIIATRMSPVQIEEAQRLAREWMKKHKPS